MGHSYRGNRSSSSSSELVSVSQTCSLFPACPTLHLTLLLCVNSYTLMRTPPLLLLWNPQTLLGLLSIPEAMHSSGQHISQSGCHPAPPVSLPPLHLHHFAPLAAPPLLHVHPASPHPPLPRHIAWLAFHRQQQEEKKENRETRMFPRLRR